MSGWGAETIEKQRLAIDDQTPDAGGKQEEGHLSSFESGSIQGC